MRTAEPFDMLHGRNTSFPPRTEVCIYHFKQINLMGWTLDECLCVCNPIEILSHIYRGVFISALFIIMKKQNQTKSPSIGK